MDTVWIIALVLLVYFSTVILTALNMESPRQQRGGIRLC